MKNVLRTEKRHRELLINEKGVLQDMLERFEGRDGRRRLIEVLADQRLVQHNDAIAQKLTDMVRVEEFPEKKQLYVRGESGKNVLYLVLSGSIDLAIQEKHLATLEPGQFVGEFPILNVSLDYAVSVFAREKSVVASVSEQQFLSLASEYPEIWKNMAKELATRLKNTNTVKQRLAASGAIKLEEITIGEIWKGLTASQLSIIITTIFAALSAVATVAYKMGTIKLFG